MKGFKTYKNYKNNKKIYHVVAIDLWNQKNILRYFSDFNCKANFQWKKCGWKYPPENSYRIIKKIMFKYTFAYLGLPEYR